MCRRLPATHLHPVWATQQYWLLSHMILGSLTKWPTRPTRCPIKFFQIHLTSTRGEFEKSVEFVAPISKFEVELQTDCVAWEDDTLDAPIARYIDIIKGERFNASAEVLVGLFHFEPGELPGNTIDLVYVEDIVRHGFSCVDLQDEENAEVPEASIFLEQFKIRARRSFDIVG